MTLRDKMAIALAKRRFWNYDGSKPIPEDAVYDADALMPLVAEDRRELVEACKAYKDLLACYRLGKKPSEKLFDALERADAALAKGG